MPGIFSAAFGLKGILLSNRRNLNRVPNVVGEKRAIDEAWTLRAHHNRADCDWRRRRTANATASFYLLKKDRASPPGAISQYSIWN